MKKILKRISCFMIVFLLVFTSVLSTLSIGRSSDNSIVLSTKADSNDRRQTLIHMAAGKNATQLTKDDELNFTDKELQTIGIFLSNFYKPFQTCVSSVDSEKNKALEEQETNALINCGFDKDIATALVQAVKKYSSSTAAEDKTGLKYQITFTGTTYKDRNKPKKDVDFSTEVEDCSYPNFLQMVTSGGKLYANDGKTVIIDFGKSNLDKAGAWYLSDNFYEDGCLAWATVGNCLGGALKQLSGFGNWGSVADNEWEPAWEVPSVDKSTVPGSTALMISSLFNVTDAEKGAGRSLFMAEEIKSAADVVKNFTTSSGTKLSDDKLARLCVTGSVLHLDCFGNIVGDFGVGQYIVVPACMNPYVFQTQVKDGDSEVKTNTYNLTNLQTVFASELFEISSNKYSAKNLTKSENAKILMGSADDKSHWVLSPSNLEDGYVMDGGNWFELIDKIAGEEMTSEEHHQIREYLGVGSYGFGMSPAAGGVAVTEKHFWDGIPMLGAAINSVGVAVKGDYDAYVLTGNKLEVKKENINKSALNNIALPKIPGAILSGDHVINAYKGAEAVEHSDASATKKNAVVSDFLVLDDIGAYEDETSTIGRTSIVDQFGASKSYVSIDLSGKQDTYYLSISESGKVFAQSIFLTYIYGYTNTVNNVWDSKGVTFQLNIGDDSVIPKPSSKNIFANIEIDTTQQLLDEGLSLAVLWMHPEKGLELVTAWVNNKVGAVLTGVHEKILGSNIANNTTATNKYIGFSGYVTMPELNDLSWTAAILEKYNSYSVLIIVIMIILLFGYAMIGRIAPFKIVTTGLIFAFLMALPPVLINGTISITNQFSDKLYGQKFIYWGLVQHENYISDINEAANSGSYEDYLSTLFQKRYDENNSTNSNVSIRLKWMCPKKDNYVQNLKETVEGDTGSAFFSQIVGALSNSSGITHEDYSESDNKVYLYRSYTDISNWARYTYMAYAGEEDWVEQSVDGVPSIKKYTDGNLKTAKDLGFNYKGVADDPLNRINPLNCSATIKDYLDKYTSSDAIRKKANLDTFLGIPTGSFKALNQINGGEADVEDLAITYFSELSESPFYFFAYNLYDQGMNWEDDDATEGFKCLALNESFDNASSTTNNDVEEGDDNNEANSEGATGVVDPDVADTINEAQGKEEEQEKEAAQMGDETNDGYFYNMSQGIVDKGGNGYGEIRDYMDMRTLFTVVIPYLKECNDMVLDYDKAFGLRTYDGYSYDPKDSSNYETKEDKRKFWVNVCTAQMFNLYTPWVDAMYDCKYAESENVRVAGKKVWVEDPLNPADYPKERPMIFSESERVYYGIKETQLTSVEQKIIEIEKNSYERLFQLMNYYTFHDTVITSAAAMIETFEFNKTFSQDSLLSDSYVLYPQAYELKNFSYDAFLRLILAQATGEDIQASASDGSLTNRGGNIYERVVKNSNMFCGLMLILNDAICIWLIPLAKFAFLLLIFAMSIVMLISCIIKIDISNMQATITKSLITPLAKFLALTIGHSFVVSCFMSEGNTAVTGATSPAITLGDPTMTLILMAIINGVVIFLFLKILIKLIRDTVTYVKAIGQDVIGMAGGVLTMATGAVRNAYNGVKGAGRGALGGLFAAGAGVAAGATLAKGLGSKVANRKSGKGGTGIGTGSGDSNSSSNSPTTSKRKERRKDTSGGINKYDEGIKNSKVKEAATSAVNKTKETASNVGNKISSGASKAKKTLGDIHAIRKDKKYKKREERYNNASDEDKKKMQKVMQRKVGRDAFIMNCASKVKNTGSKVVSTAKGVSSKAVGSVKSAGSKVSGTVKSGVSSARGYASSKKAQVKTAYNNGRTNFRKRATTAHSENAKRKKQYNDIVRYEASKPRKNKK